MQRQRRQRNKKTVKHSIKNIDLNSNLKVILIICIILLLFAMFFSVIFSIMNIGNNKIVKGIKIGNIDASNLSQEELTNKLNKYYEELINNDIKIKHEELEKNIKIKDFNPNIDIDKIVKEAMIVGKSGNIIKDNYDILFTMIFNKEIENTINIDEEKINEIIKEINNNLPNALEESNYYIEETNLIIKKGKDGIQVESEQFKKILKESINNNIKEIDIPIKNCNPEEINIEKIQKGIYKEKKDAYITENPTKVYPEVNGIDFAISIEEINKMLEEEKEEYIIPLTITVPDITLEKLGTEAFPSKLSSFTTRYDASNINRSTNLELASQKIDGTIILPGETFSYNKIVGQRTIAQGYKEAAVYSNGKVVEGIGGGICQISSTLYNAVIYANLEITERSNHRFLTSYVTEGRDATVSWGTIDFCFKNTRSYPIKVISSVKNGVATVEIYGMQEEKEYEVVIETTIQEVIPYDVKYVKDSNLKGGEEQIKQKGSNGAKSITYKILKYNGIIVSKDILSTDTYSPLERIILTGSKNKEQKNNETIDTSGFTVDKELINELNPELLETIKELQ